MAASQNGHVEVVDKLLQHGAKADLQEKVSGIVCSLLRPPICSMIWESAWYTVHPCICSWSYMWCVTDRMGGVH